MSENSGKSKFQLESDSQIQWHTIEYSEVENAQENKQIGTFRQVEKAAKKAWTSGLPTASVEVVPFINRPPVLNRELEPTPEELQETLISEDLDFDPEEQQAAKPRPPKVKYTSCKVILTGNNIEFIWRKGPKDSRRSWARTASASESKSLAETNWHQPPKWDHLLPGA